MSSTRRKKWKEETVVQENRLDQETQGVLMNQEVQEDLLDQVAQENLARARCTKQHALIAAMNARFLFSQKKDALYIAETATQNTRNHDSDHDFL